MADNESPDHAGLRSEAREVAMAVAVQSTIGNMEKHIVKFGINAWAAGRDSQESELATLRGDRSELNAEVGRLATELDTLKGERSGFKALLEQSTAMLDTMKYWMAVDECDCDTERKDGHTVRMDYPKSLELDWHLGDCTYFSCLRQLLAG